MPVTATKKTYRASVKIMETLTGGKYKTYSVSLPSLNFSSTLASIQDQIVTVGNALGGMLEFPQTRIEVNEVNTLENV